jgi:purine-cytosine permease-like protein
MLVHASAHGKLLRAKITRGELGLGGCALTPVASTVLPRNPIAEEPVVEPDTVEVIDSEPETVQDVVEVVHVRPPAPVSEPTADDAAPKPAAGKPKDARSRANSEMLEDYSLRYAPRSYRKWSEFAVANTALGGIAYLADFAIGGSLAVTFGFTNALWAILLAATVIFLTSFPIAYYSAKYSIDMDLITRGAGFGYFGGTVTSLVYASFTFIFFALEGSIMAQGLHLGLGIPLWLGYGFSALMIPPLVVFGMTLLSKMQMWTQPLWLVGMFLPFIVIAIQDPSAYSNWTHYGGAGGGHAAFSFAALGAGAGIALSLIAQIGEQVDYLRFMPTKTAESSKRWWAAVIAAGPGWVILGALKQLGGAFLAFYIVGKVGSAVATQPVEQFLAGFDQFLPYGVALGIAVFFVVLSQVKINVTNAYSGSLRWTNFFSTALRWYPGRVYFVFFNVAIALVLMEANMFSFLNNLLGFYSNVAIAWIGAVVADLVINKPLLKTSPSFIEFKRAHLPMFNPIGFGAMTVASAASIAAYFGAFGPTLDAWSPFLALTIAMVLSPVLSILLKGRSCYVAREPSVAPAERSTVHVRCSVCSEHYEMPDVALCPFHSGPICSLCCTLERSCKDVCKTSFADGQADGISLPASATPAAGHAMSAS